MKKTERKTDSLVHFRISNAQWFDVLDLRISRAARANKFLIRGSTALEVQDHGVEFALVYPIFQIV